ncbi:hypothetical protein ACA910_002893 [Epithemia clementina (nom. ined.)]
MLLYIFYQQVLYATHDQSFPSDSEERLAYWVGFGEHVGDALTHKLLDAKTNKIVYRSAVRPLNQSEHPNKRLFPVGGELPDKTTQPPKVFISSRHDEDPTTNKPMPDFNPEDPIGKTFLMPIDNNGERLRATVTDKVIEICEQLGEYEESLPEKINFKLDIGMGRAEHIVTYNQLLDHIERAKQEDEGLFRFTEITGHQGPLKAGDPDYHGSPYNVKVLWDTGEITTEPLNMIASDDPVTCAVYAKKHDLLELPGWKRFKHLAKNQKKLARAINQTKMRQARATPVYMFGYRVPKDYKEAMELDKQNGNSKWFDAVETEMAQIKEYNVFKDGGKAAFDNH